MMRNKKKYLTLLGILAALVLILLLPKLNKPSLPKTKAMKSVDKIEIIKPNGETLTFIDNGDVWLINPGEYVADEDLLNRAMTAMLAFKITDHVSFGKSLNNYGLEESERLEIKAYEGDKVKLDFYMGKVGETYRHTYVQLPKNKNVYLANDHLNDIFNKDASQFKSKTICEISPDEVSEIHMEENGNKYSLVRTYKTNASTNAADSRVVWQSSWKGECEDRGIQDFLRGFVKLSASQIVEQDTPPSFLRKVRLVTSTGDVSLTVLEKGSDDNYLFSRDGRRVLFKVATPVASRVMKNIDEF